MRERSLVLATKLIWQLGSNTRVLTRDSERYASEPYYIRLLVVVEGVLLRIPTSYGGLAVSHWPHPTLTRRALMIKFPLVRQYARRGASGSESGSGIDK